MDDLHPFFLDFLFEGDRIKVRSIIDEMMGVEFSGRYSRSYLDEFLPAFRNKHFKKLKFYRGVKCL